MFRKPVAIGITLLLFASVCMLSACNSSSEQTPDPTPSSSASMGEKPSVPTEPEDSNSDGTIYPLTVQNYDTDWKAIPQTFARKPERVVGNTQGVTELLLQLGLADRLVGTAAEYGPVYPDVAGDYAKIPLLSKDYASKELVVGANPDLIIGRGELFSDIDWGHGTVKALNALGIKTYLQHASRPGAVLNDLFTDIQEIGEIFNIQERATAYKSELQKRLDNLSGKLANVKETRKFVFMLNYDGNSSSIFAGERLNFQNDAVKFLKLVPATKAMSEGVGAEQLLAMNPDVILYVDYSGQTTDKIVKSIYENPSLKSLQAVKDKQIHIVDFNTFMTYSFTIIDGIEKLGKDLYPDLIKNHEKG